MSVNKIINTKKGQKILKTGLMGVIKNKTVQMKPQTGHWSQGLLATMKDPDFVVEEDNLVVVVKDKYPKAKHHFLIIAKDNIIGISKLDTSHSQLLNHMSTVASKLISKIPSTFKIGFHSVPSMQRLHMHVISDDFISPCLKTKIHWNSFTTDFFIPAENLIQDIEKNGSIKVMTTLMHKQLMASPLKCHKCNFSPKNIPALKDHLLSHA